MGGPDDAGALFFLPATRLQPESSGEDFQTLKRIGHPMPGTGSRQCAGGVSFSLRFPSKPSNETTMEDG